MVEKQVAGGHHCRLRAILGWRGPAPVQEDSSAKSQVTQLDLEYVALWRTLSGPRVLWHDLKVLGRSLRTVLRGRGAALLSGVG